MTVRTTRASVTFVNPFTLGDFDEVLPPGVYEVETDEELLDGLSFQAFRRTATLFHLTARFGHPRLSRTLTIDPNDLAAALGRDAASGALSPELPPTQTLSTGMPIPYERETERRSMRSRGRRRDNCSSSLGLGSVIRW